MLKHLNIIRAARLSAEQAPKPKRLHERNTLNPTGSQDADFGEEPSEEEIAEIERRKAEVKAASLAAFAELPWDGYHTCGDQRAGLRQYAEREQSGVRIYRPY